MLREFAEATYSTAQDTHRRAFLTKVTVAIMAMTCGEIAKTTQAQEPSSRKSGSEMRENKSSFSSIEEWLQGSPESLRAKKALLNLTKLDDDQPEIREATMKEIIESLQIVQRNILPLPQEFMRPLEDTYEKARAERKAEVFLGCKRILQTLRASEIDSPSSIPFGIEFKAEAFPEILSKHLGLTISGIDDEISTMIIRNLSRNRTPGAILGLLIRTDHFIKIDPNGGTILIRSRVSSDDEQQAYDSGSICLVTTFNAEDSYRETDALRPRNRGPLLEVYSFKDLPFYTSTFLDRPRDLYSTSKEYRQGKHSVALPRPRNYVAEVPGPYLSRAGAIIQECNCMQNDPSYLQPKLGFVHASNPTQIPLKEGVTQTPLLSIQTVRKDRTMIITMTPKVQPKSEANHSTICSLAGWSTFSVDGKKVPASISMIDENIVWTINNIPADQSVDCHTHLSMDLSSTTLPYHP